jgi:site-specific DNA-methyltransferase (adenine-specific)
MAVAIEDSGFEIRDQIMWVYGSGFPKSMDVSKAIDKQFGAERKVIGTERNFGASKSEDGKIAFGDYPGEWNITTPNTSEAKQWEGWGTALKPAHEPIVMARKPLDGTVASTVLKHGTGGINVDGCRVLREEGDDSIAGDRTATFGTQETISGGNGSGGWEQNSIGRFPANFIHDGSDEVLQLFPSSKPNQSAARFFYCAKASTAERNKGLEDFPDRRQDEDDYERLGTTNPRNRSQKARKNHHPTVKPVDLMRYLVRLVTPPNGTVLDPFLGSGTTAVAAILEGFQWVGCEMNEEYAELISARVNSVEKINVQ